MSTYFVPRTGHPALELFLGLYLETLVLDFADDWDAARSFVREEHRWGPSLTSEIQQVLATEPSEIELESFFRDELRTEVDPRDDGYSFREWLCEIVRVVEDPKYTPPSSTDHE